MPIPDNVCTVQETYSILGTDEIVVNAWHVKLDTSSPTFNAGGNWTALTQELADQWVAHKATHWGDVSPYISNIAELVQVKAMHLDNTGHALDVGRHLISDHSIKGAASTTLPPECAILLRLNCVPTGQFSQHGRRRKGRVFLGPVSKSSIDSSTGQISSADRDALTTALGSWLNDVQGMHLGFSGDVYPRTGVLSKTDGAFYQLESITVPANLGVQRRRQNKLLNAVSAPVTISHN